ncbi:MAG: thymidylate kinase [Patescibacteria group bacterium]
MARSRKKGKLIVIDGTDGSGKATQTDLLLKRFKKEGLLVKKLDFPRYEDNFFGKFIGECLAGEHGDFVSLDPRIASSLYAFDRFETKPLIEKWLSAGYTVILDRYVSSNQIHQGGKILDSKARKKFLLWLDTLEFGILGLPRPDAILYLDVPLSVTERLLVSKGQQEKKVYLTGKKKDTVENSQKYLSESRESALGLVKKQNNWIRIQCTKKGEMLSREEVALLVWENVRKIV